MAKRCRSLRANGRETEGYCQSGNVCCFGGNTWRLWPAAGSHSPRLLPIGAPSACLPVGSNLRPSGQGYSRAQRDGREGLRMEIKMSNAGVALRTALGNFDDWDISEYTAVHRPSKTIWWIGNGAWFFDAYRAPSTLGLVERHFLWRSYKRMVNAQVAALLNGAKLTNEPNKTK